MNKYVIIITLLLSLAFAVVNNLVSRAPVSWLGTQKVYEKPEGF